MISDFEAEKRAERLLDGPRLITDEEALKVAARRYWDAPAKPEISDEEALRIAEGHPRRTQIDLTKLIRKFHK